MSRSFHLTTCVALAASCSLALAAPRETLSLSNVISDGAHGAATNEITLHTFTGSYAVASLRFTANLTANSPATYSGEALIEITPPSGAPFVVQLFPGGTFSSLSTTNFQIDLGAPLPPAAGSWSFRFFEGFDDAGIDATWTTLQITLDDAHDTAIWSEILHGDAGETVSAAQAVTGTGPLPRIDGSGTGSDADLYKIMICDPANFSATTLGGTSGDTQLFLFDATGHGVSADDDDASVVFGPSTISHPVLAGPGVYYLAISLWNHDPVTANGDLIWLDDPTNQHAPDGPGAAGTLDHWTGSNDVAADYRIFLTGACFVSGPTCGSADFNGDGDVGTDQDIEAFFACLAGTCCPTCGTADFNGDGDVGTDQDIESFFRILAGGNC